MYANDTNIARILEESKKTAAAQNPNINQPAAQEIDEQTKLEQEKKKQEEQNRKMLFESAKKVAKQEKTIPINENIEQFVENKNLKFLILKNDDCVTNEFCESFEIQLAPNNTLASSKLQDYKCKDFLQNFSQFFETNRFGYEEYENKFEGDFEVALADLID